MRRKTSGLLVLIMMFSFIGKIEVGALTEREFVRVYFNKPVSEQVYSSRTYGGTNLEQKLLQYLDEAEESIDIAVYDLNVTKIEYDRAFALIINLVKSFSQSFT